MTDPAPLTRRQRRAQLRASSERFLTPAFRRWAYGVAGAAVAAAVFAGWLPEGALAVILPLIMAVLYVDKTGAPL
ncbi:holin [Microbacterium phage Azizam]|uniref:Membrane protein n=3 Tax=Paopuvirus TaxID=2948855 RepID=A0A7D5JEU8_9CAUD|nr:holin [Microbacterium phage Azizam]YP_009996654.1 holin [Microbacterium phage Bri160]YP_009996780.1 holin [Microbacterium phage Quaker]AXC34902.1 membrane protein [Microbacterium phage VitulaEligans]AXC35377.1 membrane protein [Microbacterium phage KayPaulus]QDF18046.1 membrane protein [Microbacterium phage Belthelas]QJD53917.1 membrane protein [Microbacterium phage McShie]QKY78785.1 membrane protein [Microbacterium phage Livingwater]QNJ56061.1 membrane protein [Microbacterium phage JRok